MRTLFSCFLVRLALYGVLISALVIFQFPQLIVQKKVQSLKKVPQSVRVSLVAPPKPKPKKIIKPKPKPKKLIKPKPKKRVKPKPKPKPKPIPKAEVKEIPKIVPPDVNITKPKKVEIKKIEPVVEIAVIPEPTVVEVLTFEEENKIENYKAYLEETIRLNKKYPTKARRMRHQGIVKIRFIIDKNGKILESEIVRSSGFSTLDKATIALFKRIDDFDDPPEALETPYEFTVPLVYKLK